ncbi:MAG TPA: hypothetical protein QGF05_13585 [Dehalococcoidia bacterium]|nr:hypothetical protein [Dehalococcoidia bacterium]
MEFLRAEGGQDALVEAIKEKRWRDLSGLTPRQTALCEVAEKMSASATKMVEADWQPLRDLGFSDEALLEVGHIVGIFNYLVRMADGFGLLIDPEVEAAKHAGTKLERQNQAQSAPHPR